MQMSFEELAAMCPPPPPDTLLRMFVDGEHFSSSDSVAHIALDVKLSEMNFIQGSSLTVEEYNRRRRVFADSLFTNHARLLATLERHELKLQQRWQSMRPAQRESTLKEAWPEILPCHRPDWVVLRKELKLSSDGKKKLSRPTDVDASSTEVFPANSEARDALLWPYLNLEDLAANAKPLLLLFKSRGRNRPEAFATADRVAMNFASDSKEITTYSIDPPHTAVMNGNAPELYGRVMANKTLPDNTNFAPGPGFCKGRDMINQGTGMHPGESLLVLEIQEHLIKFLVKCCEVILPADLVRESSLYDHDIQPEPEIKVGDATIPLSVLTLRMENPYTVPGQLQLDRLQALIHGRISASHEHIHLLREDPNYFAQTVQDYRDHAILNLPHADGCLVDIKKKHGSRVFWWMALSSMIREAYTEAILWPLAGKFLDEFVASLKSNAEGMKKGSSVPAGIKLPFRNFWRLLELLQHLSIISFAQTLPGAPAFRKYFHLRCQHEKGKGALAEAERRNIRCDSDILVLFDNLRHKGIVELWGVANLTDEMERLMDKDSKSDGMVTPHLRKQYEQVAFVAELTRQLSLFQPWGDLMRRQLSIFTVLDSKWQIHKELQSYESLISFIRDVSNEGKFLKNLLGKGRFDYPVESARSQKVVQRMQRAEKNLDEFWAEWEEDFRQHQLSDARYRGQAVRTSFQVLGDIVKSREVQRTPDWVGTSDTETVDAKMNLLELQYRTEKTLDNESTSRSKQEDSTQKHKVKTKGLSTLPSGSNILTHAGDIENAQSTSPEPENLASPIFTVGKKAYKTLTALFCDPDANSDATKEIAWSAFVNAMTQIGFAAEKLYGSVWQFTPTDGTDVKHSLQIHEPHPSAKLVYWNARRIGRRLTRKFGWTGSTFARK